MSADATGHVWKYSPYTGKPLLIHLAIADVVNDTHNWEFYGGIKALMEKTRVSRRTVINALALMESDGHLKRMGVHANGTTNYKFLFAEGVQPFPEGVQPFPEGGATISRGGCNEAESHCLSTKEELKEPLYQNASPSVPELDRQFEKTWKPYPRKINKGPAKRAYFTLRKTDVNPWDIHDAVVNYAEACKSKSPEFILHGSTFFAKDRWRDWLPDGAAMQEAAIAGDENIEFYDAFGKPVYK